MDFLISGQHINPIYLVILGFIIGIFGGFFGVGGSFIAGPGLFMTGLPMNFVVEVVEEFWQMVDELRRGNVPRSAKLGRLPERLQPSVRDGRAPAANMVNQRWW